jgi:hypothetical protein
MTSLVNLGLPLVKTLVKNPLNTLFPHVSPETFVAFSEFHLNTSKYPNAKVVYFVEGHNFPVEWHCWFEVQNGEKCRSMLLGTFHWHLENNKLCLQFVQKWMRKTVCGLCRSCRGLRDLELCYSPLGPLLLKNLEQNTVEQGQVIFFKSAAPHVRAHA